MKLSGIQRFTLLDYPDKVACIVFTPGCQFRCGYCHNPEFVLPELLQEIKDSFIEEELFFRFLETRKGKLEGVVISGGEPTMMADLLPFMRKIKERGFFLKLDTNGNRSEVIAQLLKEQLVDYIAMDVKTALSHYTTLVGKRVKETQISKSIQLLKQSTIPYEFRTTLIKEVHTNVILENMASILQGAERLFLQEFRPGKTLNPLFASYHPFSTQEMMGIAQIFFEKKVKKVIIR